MAWADEIVKTRGEFVLFARVDGWPRWIFERVPPSSGVGAWTPPGGVTFISGLVRPESIRQGVNPLQARAQVSHVQLKMVDTPISGALAPFNLTRALGGTARLYGDTTVWYDTIEESRINPGGTSLTFHADLSVPAMPFYLYVGLETVQVTSLIAGRTYAVTRRRFPCVDAAPDPGGFLHENSVDSDSPEMIGATEPFAWYNRYVALYVTWIDERGRWGAQADARLLWTGRIKSVAFDGKRDTWSLDCAPIIEDLGRQVMAGPVAQTHMVPGIDLRGWPAERRRIGITVGSSSTATAAVAEAFYESVDALIGAIEAVMPGPAGTYGNFAWWHGPDANGDIRVRIWWFASTTGQSMARVNIPLPIAAALGFGGSTSWTGTDILIEIQSSSFSLDAGVAAEDMPAIIYWNTDCSQLRAWDNGAAFTSGSMGSGLGNPAVEMAGRTVARYSSRSASIVAGIGSVIDFTMATPNVAASNTAMNTIGAEQIIVREGEDATQATVQQVFYGPRSFGNAGGFSLSGIMIQILDMLVSIIGDGTNGTYDRAARGYGIGLPREFVDAQSFVDVANRFPSDMQERRWLLREPTPLAKIVDTEGQTLGFYVLQVNGLLTARLSEPALIGASPVTLDMGNSTEIEDRTGAELGPRALMNTMEIKYDIDPFGSADAAPSVRAADEVSVRIYGEQRGLEIEHPALFTFSTSDPIDIVVAAWTRMVHYAHPRWVLSRRISRDLFTRILPGDTVALTDSFLPDPNMGNRGVTARPCQVLSVEENWRTGVGTVQLALESVRPTSLRTPLCPSAMLTAFNVVGNIATIAVNEFTDAGESTDVAWFTVGDRVIVYQGDPADPTASTVVARAINAISGNDVTLDGAIGGMNPATGVVYMTFDVRGTVVTDQVDEGTWLAGSDDNFISNDRTRPAARYS